MALTLEEVAKLIADVLKGDQGFNRIQGADVYSPATAMPVIRVTIGERTYGLILVGERSES